MLNHQSGCIMVKLTGVLLAAAFVTLFFYFSTTDKARLNRHEAEYLWRVGLFTNSASNLVLNNNHLLYTFDFATEEIFDLNQETREMLGLYALSYIYLETKDVKTGSRVKIVLNNLHRKLKLAPNGKYYISYDLPKSRLGAEAMGLAAVLYFEKAAHKDNYKDLREKLKEGLLACFADKKGFLFNPLSDYTWPYFDGESWYALAIYADMFPEDKSVADIIGKIDDTLMNVYQNRIDAGFTHWGMQAAAQRYLTTHDKKFLDFMWNIFLLYEQQEPYINAAGCAYLEALGDMAKAFNAAGENNKYNRIVDRFNLEKNTPFILQVTTKHLANGKKVAKTREKFIGLFLPDVNESQTTVDVMGHCAVAVLKNKAQYLSK
jgi:hypothetical protein